MGSSPTQYKPLEHTRATERLEPRQNEYSRLLPLPINWTSKLATLHDTGFGKNNVRASKATGNVTRLFAHTWPLQTPDAAANPLRKPPRRAWQVGEGGGGSINFQKRPERAQIGPLATIPPPGRSAAPPTHLVDDGAHWERLLGHNKPHWWPRGAHFGLFVGIFLVFHYQAHTHTDLGRTLGLLPRMGLNM